MPITINGTTGIAGVDGSASTPSLQGADTNTGMFFPAADTIAFAEGGAEVMRIDSSGNVGIGTSSPAYRLDTAGVTRSQVQSGATNNTAPTAFVVANKTTGAHAAGLGASIQFEYTNSGGAYSGGQISSVGGADPFTADLRFFPRNYGFAEAMRIDSSGNVMVGTTSSSRKFQVKGIVGYEQISGGTNVWEAYQNTDNTYRLNYNGSGSDEFVLYTNGNYLFLGSNVSDIRLKQDIDFETPQLANILSLTPKTYKFKPIETQSGEIGTASGVKHGFIAQDILEIVPELVNGNPLNENEILGVDYNGIVAMCVKAIQEQQTIIESLKTDIAELKAKVGK